ncbi:MAG: thioredoxin domain-containing protein [Myxococcales bacterium]|jgi:thioredoxin 1
MSTTHLTSANFEETIEGQGIVFIDFWAEWCGPCKAFAPIYEKAAAAHPDITWAKVDVESEQDLAGGFGIRAIPTLMVFRDGIPIFSQPGLLPGDILTELADKVRALDMDEVRAEIARAQAEQR